MQEIFDLIDEDEFVKMLSRLPSKYYESSDVLNFEQTYLKLS